MMMIDDDDEHVQLSVFDGRTCDAVKVGNELHELLFSLPMMKENQVRQ